MMMMFKVYGKLKTDVAILMATNNIDIKLNRIVGLAM
jgi:hypothetical protein